MTNYALNDYAWLTGDALNADHTQVAYSGICLQNASSPSCGENNIGMSVQFFKLQTIHYPNSPAWDFSRYQPNQVVINLGTNDWNTPNSTFQSLYITFLQNVRAKYPNAEIFVLRTFGGYKAALTSGRRKRRKSAPGIQRFAMWIQPAGSQLATLDSDNLHPTMNGHIKIANRLQSILGTTPVPTATRTSTPNVPTITPTRTNTPNGPTLTPTRTSTPGTVTATPTVGATPTSGSTGSTCSPVTSTIIAPFSFDGAGTFCWQSTNLGSYINSWNTTSVTLNGVNVTNIYVASGSYPAKVNGFWYVSYSSSVAWGHFEAK